MSEHDDRPQAAAMSEADARMAKVIFFTSMLIGAILLVALALPALMERF